MGMKKKVISGKYKCYKGIIWSVNDSGIWFELSAINKLINIPFESINLKKPFTVGS